jgi:molecular chaperone GrpE
MEEERRDNTQPSPRRVGPEDDMNDGTPLSLEDQLDAFKAEAEELNREKGQFKDMLQRAQADFINYKRRAEEDREEQQKHSNSRLILKLLPVMDEFNLALAHAFKSEMAGPWLEGVKLIQRKLSAVLESESVTRIEAEGKQFDPFEHEAMAYQDSADHKEGEIITVVRDGYKLHDRVIRPALVTLAKKPESAE